VRCVLPSIALVIATIAIGRVAHADDAPAGEDKRPMAALSACASGDVAKGIAILGELYAESRNPAYVYNQGRCFQKNGQLEQARVRFDEYVRIGAHEPPEDIQRAQALIKEIDETLARQRANEPVPVIVTPAAPQVERSRSLRIASVVLGAVGVVAVGAGVYLSFKVKATNEAFDSEFANQTYVTDEARLERLLSDGKSYETWQWVGYGLGVAALAAAATTFILGGGFGTERTPAGAQKAALDLVPLLSPGTAGGVVRWRF